LSILQSFADNNHNEDNDSCYCTRKCDDDSDSDILCVNQRSKHATPSQDAMLKHMADLQMHQGMPWVCWRDFKELNLAHGTIRNNLSKLKEMGLIEYSHKSNDAYYTLPKDSLQKTMTLDHLWVTKPQLALLIKRLVFDAPAAHNIRLYFQCPTIYNTVLGLKAM
jgi:DNA-binding transcriptional ArsR family regulator